MPGDQQHDGEVHHLLVGQALTVGLYRGQPADQVFARVGAPVGAVLAQVGEHVRGGVIDLPGEFRVVGVRHVAVEEPVRPSPEQLTVGDRQAEQLSDHRHRQG
ncbi:MAG: hypothetical protein DLM60_01470 [Pseudonocardiales bacterium]|nr:MAG: hypothetical protein DLM60_01470 [Pseudonocardiales bacterium]